MSQKTISFTLALLALAVISSEVLAKTDVPNRPNVIYILADDLGYDSISAMNPEMGMKTPNFDKLLANGIYFTDAHSGCAVCSPTRYGVLTGRYSWRSRLKRGIVGRWERPLISEERLTVGKMFQELGYATACIGKWHLGWNWHDAQGNKTTKAAQVDFTKRVTGGPIERGFDYYFGDDVPNWPPYVWIENDKTVGVPVMGKSNFTRAMKLPGPDLIWGDAGPAMPGWDQTTVLPEITKRSVAYIEEQAKNKEKPFFLYFSLTSPHTPISPSPAFQGKSGVNYYADLLLETDATVGAIMQAIEKAGIAENTLLILTSDNGTSPKCDFDFLEKKNVKLRNTWRGWKADIYEGGHRVVFAVNWKGIIKPGSVCDEIIWNGDFFATVAEITGFKLPPNAAEDSVSLLPLLLGKKIEKPLHEAVINLSSNGSFAVRQGAWKAEFCRGSAGWSPANPAQGKAPGQLYNLANDPKENKNHWLEQPERVEAMRKVLRKIVEDGRSTPGPKQKNHGDWWSQLPWKK